MNLFYTPEYAKTGDVIPFYNQKTKRFENYYLKNWNPDAPKDKIVYGWHHNGRQPDLQRNPDKHSGWNRVCDRSGRCLPYVLLYLRSEPAGPVGKTCDKQRS